MMPLQSMSAKDFAYKIISDYIGWIVDASAYIFRDTLVKRCTEWEAVIRADERENVRRNLIDGCKKAGCDYINVELLQPIHFEKLLNEAQLVKSSEGERI